LLSTKPKSVHFGDILEGKTDFWLIGWREASFDLSEEFVLHIHSFNAELGTGSWNAGKYSNEKVDNLLKEASEALSLEKREQLLQEANRVAMEDIAVIPLYKQPDLYAHKNGINFTPRADMFILASEISFK
jgi:peptide/nickel transport system substrate-binding protein